MTNAQSRKGGRLDTFDMERRIVEFRLALDREKRRCQQAQMLDTFERLLKDKLSEESPPPPSSAANLPRSINLDRLDHEGFRRLRHFLQGAIELCGHFEQHEQFQNLVREVLQTARKRHIQAAMQAGRDPASEPFCLFCGTKWQASGCNHQAAATCEEAPMPIERAPTNGHSTNGFHLHTNGLDQTVVPADEVAGALPAATATPPPSNAPTPDPFGLNSQQQQQRQQHDSSLQRLRSQFQTSFTSRSQQQPQADERQNNAEMGGSNSTTPPMSPNVAARLIIQQQQQTVAALKQAAASQQSVTTNASKDQASQQQQRPPQQQQQSSARLPLFVPDSDNESMSAYDEHGPDSVRAAIEQIDDIDLPPMSEHDDPRQQTCPLEVAVASGQHRSSTPMAGEQHSSSELVIDETANLSQERTEQQEQRVTAAAAHFSPIRPAVLKTTVKSSHKTLQKQTHLVRVNLDSSLAGRLRNPQHQLQRQPPDLITATTAGGPSAARRAVRMQASSPSSDRSAASTQPGRYGGPVVQAAGGGLNSSGGQNGASSQPSPATSRRTRGGNRIKTTTRRAAN